MCVCVFAHHKDAACRRSGVAAADWLTCSLVLEGLSASKDGVVVERVHQVGVHIAKKETNLGWDETDSPLRPSG